MNNKNTLLIVDDYEFNRRMIVEMFPDYTVIEAENGFKAIEEYEKHKDEICAVLSDIMMPVLDGFGLLEYFYKNKYLDAVPVFMISADNSPKTLQRAFTFGAQNVINKSSNQNFIVKQIENTIELFRLREIVSNLKGVEEDSETLSETELSEDI